MDRIIKNQKRSKFFFFKEFEYLDLFPYSIAFLMLLGEIYILHSFIEITGDMH